MAKRPVGRPKKHAEYEALVRDFKKGSKRPDYVRGVGVFVGKNATTAWVRVTMRKGGTYKGRHYKPGDRVEIKVGNLKSFEWDELEGLRDDFQKKADKGKPLEDAKALTFTDFATEWIEGFKRRNDGKGGTTEDNLNAHLLKYFGAKPLNEITVQNVNRYVSKRMAAAKPSTVKREINTLNTILNSAVDEGLIVQNPVKRIPRNTFKGIQPRDTFLQPFQIDKLVEAAGKGPEWLPDLVLWFVHSGMRRGEVLAMKERDIVPMPNGRQQIHIPKSKTGRARYVPCNATMNAILDRQRARGFAEDGRVWNITLQVLRNAWKQALIDAEFTEVIGEKNEKPIHKPLFTLHDLRRTHITLAVMNGVDPRTLAERVGHADTTMIMRVYAAHVPDAGMRAADLIEQAFTGSPEPTGEEALAITGPGMDVEQA